MDAQLQLNENQLEQIFSLEKEISLIKLDFDSKQDELFKTQEALNDARS